MVVERRPARPPATTGGPKASSKGDGLAGQASNRSSTSVTPTGSGRGTVVRPLQRVPSISARPTVSRAKEHGHAPITDPALKLRRPGKEEISYIMVLNKAGALVKQTKPAPGGRVLVGDDLGVWLRLGTDGVAETVKVRMSDLRQDLGIQPRDLRLLDPTISKSYPSAILVRGSAILVKMEHIKCIITTDCVLLLGADQPEVKSFAEELGDRLVNAMPVGASSLDLLSRRYSASATLLARHHPSDTADLPFELRALEAALDAVCREMEGRTKKLEILAQPCFQMQTRGKMLDDFLARLRQVKSRLGSLRIKIETMKEVLEDFLDDENDMVDLNLTARERQRAQPAEETFRRRMVARLHSQDSFRERTFDSRRSFDARSLGLSHPLTLPTVATILEHATDSFTDKGRTEAVEDLAEEEAEQLQVEMLLETYFMHLDHLYERLQDMKENMEATATMLDIELDQYRNDCIRIRMTTNAGALFAGLIFSISGCMAMMLGDGKAFDPNSYASFLVTSITMSSISILLFCLLLVYLHRRGLGPSNLAS